jgi:hypothetical protein
MIHQAFCKNCYKRFVKDTTRQFYCSVACKQQYLEKAEKFKFNSKVIAYIVTHQSEKGKQDIVKKVRIKTSICHYCQEEITSKRYFHHYCSVKCHDYHNKNIPLGELAPRKCRYCEQLFTPKDEIERFCSAECRTITQKKAMGYR